MAGNHQEMRIILIMPHEDVTSRLQGVPSLGLALNHLLSKQSWIGGLAVEKEIAINQLPNRQFGVT